MHLIDGPVYVFRAYHSLPAMSAPDGTPTNAAYGFANRLLEYLAFANVTRALATLRRDVPGLAAELPSLVWRGADREAIEPLFARLGWGKIATRITRWA